MTDLGEEGRALIELARDAHDPTDEDRARVRMALTARLGAAAGLGMAARLAVSAKAASTTTAAGAAGVGATAGTVAGGALATKLIGSVVVIIAAAWGGAAAVHRARRAPTVAIAARVPSGAASQPTRVTASPGLSPAKPDNVEGTARPLEARSIEARPRMPERHRSAAASAAFEARPPEPRPTEVTDRHVGLAAPSRPARQATEPASPPLSPALADEARLLHDGVAALRAGQPAQALASFDAHAVLYPRGVLAAERAAERALALAALGRDAEARAAAEEFLRVYPASPLAARLRKRFRAPAAP